MAFEVKRLDGGIGAEIVGLDLGRPIDEATRAGLYEAWLDAIRISTEVGRMNVDMVWAEIAVAALAGSTFYGGIALIERAVTFWHPSIRSGRT